MSVMSNRRAFLKAAGLTTAAAFARPALAGEAPPEPAAGTRIVAGPYLQNVTPDGATVMWITDKPCVSWVDYGASPDMRYRLQDSHDGLIDAYETVHRIRIAGLTPWPASLTIRMRIDGGTTQGAFTLERQTSHVRANRRYSPAARVDCHVLVV